MSFTSPQHLPPLGPDFWDPQNLDGQNSWLVPVHEHPGPKWKLQWLTFLIFREASRMKKQHFISKSQDRIKSPGLGCQDHEKKLPSSLIGERMWGLWVGCAALKDIPMSWSCNYINSHMLPKHQPQIRAHLIQILFGFQDKHISRWKRHNQAPLFIIASVEAWLDLS